MNSKDSRSLSAGISILPMNDEQWTIKKGDWNHSLYSNNLSNTQREPTTVCITFMFQKVFLIFFTSWTSRTCLPLNLYWLSGRLAINENELGMTTKTTEVISPGKLILLVLFQTRTTKLLLLGHSIIFSLDYHYLDQSGGPVLLTEKDWPPYCELP